MAATPDEVTGPIYLDHNATTPLDPRVLEAMTQVWRDCGANPASQHAAGRRARRYVEDAREDILSLLGGHTEGMASDRLIFTSGGTEANHLALRGLLDPSQPTRGLAISRLEHPSIQTTAEHLSRQGTRVEILPVKATGIVDVRAVEALIDREPGERPQLISLMLASNETGALQPVSEVGDLVKDTDMLLHGDACQALGELVSMAGNGFRLQGLAALTAAAHKINGPIGIGCLVLRHGVQLAPQMFGGFQQAGLRPGTENAPLAVGFLRALELWREGWPARRTRMCELRNELQATLQREIPNSVIIAGDVDRTPHTLCIAFPPLDRQALVMALDLAGVACSTGSACASGSSEPSPTLVAMGLPPEVVGSALRFSLGAFTRPAEVRSAAERIIKTVKQLQQGR